MIFLNFTSSFQFLGNLLLLFFHFVFLEYLLTGGSGGFFGTLGCPKELEICRVSFHLAPHISHIQYFILLIDHQYISIPIRS